MIEKFITIKDSTLYFIRSLYIPQGINYYYIPGIKSVEKLYFKIGDIIDIELQKNGYIKIFNYNEKNYYFDDSSDKLFKSKTVFVSLENYRDTRIGEIIDD